MQPSSPNLWIEVYTQKNFEQIQEVFILSCRWTPPGELTNSSFEKVQPLHSHSPVSVLWKGPDVTKPFTEFLPTLNYRLCA